MAERQPRIHLQSGIPEYDARMHIFKNMRPWLNNRTRKASRMVDWLQGYGIGIINAAGDEPFEWISRAVEVADKPDLMRARLAQALVEILDTEADLQKEPDRRISWREGLVYNAFMLAGDLGQPEILIPALEKLLQERHFGEARWHGYSLQGALEDSITRNQRMVATA